MTEKSDLRRQLEPLRRIQAPEDFTARVITSCALDSHTPHPGRVGTYLSGAVMGLAAVLAVMLWTGRLDLSGPAAPDPVATVAYDADQISSARAELAWTVNLTARVLDHSGSQALREIFDDRLPEAINRSLMSTFNANPKGNS